MYNTNPFIFVRFLILEDNVEYYYSVLQADRSDKRPIHDRLRSDELHAAMRCAVGDIKATVYQQSDKARRRNQDTIQRRPY